MRLASRFIERLKTHGSKEVRKTIGKHQNWV